MDPVLVAGLGNPGRAYRSTRHNVGFRVLDVLARRLEVPFVAGKGDYLIARTITGDRELVLLQPVTYMNNSGRALVQALEQTPVPLENLLVVTDDFAIPLGTLRLRPRGSDGGHHGLASVIMHLLTDEFARLRCGIGRDTMPSKDRLHDFVLSPFEPAEEATVHEMTERAADAVLVFATSGITEAMNKYNS